MGVGWVQFDIPAEHIAFPLALAPVQSIPSQSMVDRMEGVGGLVVGWKIEVDVDVDVDGGDDDVVHTAFRRTLTLPWPRWYRATARVCLAIACHARVHRARVHRG